MTKVEQECSHSIVILNQQTQCDQQTSYKTDINYSIMKKKNTQGDSRTHGKNSGTIADTNEEHTRIDEDQAWIEENTTI